jgi:hypothetical protein
VWPPARPANLTPLRLGEDKVLVLTTSNASKKYFTDAFGVLSWPRGWIVHFRYQVQWIDEELRDLLPQKIGGLQSSAGPLKNIAVLAAYLFQETESDQRTNGVSRKQVALYPLRYGTLVAAYRIGKGRYDAAHFYFRVGGYYLPTAAKAPFVNPNDLVRPGIYAALRQFQIVQSDPADDESAAYTLIEGVQPGHVTFQPNQSNLTERRKYFPVLCFVRDLRRAGRRGGVLTPRFESSARGSYYEFTERKEYLFDFSFYVPTWSATPGSGSKVSLEYDDRAFATTAKRTLAVESRYDEQAWLVVPAAADRKILRELAFVSDVTVPKNAEGEAANVALTIPVTIKQDKLLRVGSAILRLLAAAGLTIGTISVALLPSAIQKPQAGLPIGLLAVGIAVGYSLWLLISTVSGRGKS